MGRLWSYKDWSHELTINGVQLGDAIEIDGDPATYEWDDSRIPNGEVDEYGNVVTSDEG